MVEMENDFGTLTPLPEGSDSTSSLPATAASLHEEEQLRQLKQQLQGTQRQQPQRGVEEAAPPTRPPPRIHHLRSAPCIAAPAPPQCQPRVCSPMPGAAAPQALAPAAAGAPRTAVAAVTGSGCRATSPWRVQCPSPDRLQATSPMRITGRTSPIRTTPASVLREASPMGSPYFRAAANVYAQPASKLVRTRVSSPLRVQTTPQSSPCAAAASRRSLSPDSVNRVQVQPHPLFSPPPAGVRCVSPGGSHHAGPGAGPPPAGAAVILHGSGAYGSVLRPATNQAIKGCSREEPGDRRAASSGAGDMPVVLKSPVAESKEPFADQDHEVAAARVKRPVSPMPSGSFPLVAGAPPKVIPAAMGPPMIRMSSRATLPAKLEAVLLTRAG